MKQILLFLISILAISVDGFGNHYLDPPSEAPLPIDITIPLVDDVSCQGASDGSATIVIAGLSLLTSYSYEVTNSDDEVIESGDEALLEDLISDLLNLDVGLTIRIEDLPAGIYTFSWTTDPLIGGPTTQSIDFTVEEPQPSKSSTSAWMIS